MLKRILITGANAGIGKESARQLALVEGTEKIYLGCRNQEKAEQAKAELTQITGKDIFEVLLIDVADSESVKLAVKQLSQPIDALIMNAGGAGGTHFNQRTTDGVTQQFAVNVFGHAVLLENLLATEKLTQVALYAGSEAARGVKEMGMERPNLKTSSVEEFVSIGNGSFFASNKDSQASYGTTKYVGALWMAALSRKHPNIRFVTMSPGGTKGTQVLESEPLVKRFVFKLMMQAMSMFGKVHSVDVAAKRFVTALLDDSYKSGVFYGSRMGISGPIVDQATLFSDLSNFTHQDNAREAITRFMH